MFDAIFKASNGLTFSFGYKAGVLWSITPLGDLPVDLETSQGYQQVGATVESRSISGVTRTVKEMEAKGYLQKMASPDDGRVTFLTATEKGRKLHQKYDEEYFSGLLPYFDSISEEEAETMIATIEKFYQIMSGRRATYDKR